MDSATKMATPRGEVDEHALHAVSHELISPVVQRWIDESKQDPEAFWGRAAEQLPWFRKWERVLEWTPPTFKWFVGAQTNLAYNALDYHVKRGHEIVTPPHMPQFVRNDGFDLRIAQPLGDVLWPDQYRPEDSEDSRFEDCIGYRQPKSPAAWLPFFETA